MKAICLRRFGAPDVLALETLPDLQPVAADDVVIGVKAASVNAADSKVRAGKSVVKAVFPHVLGRDFSGVVLAAGPQADLKPGDEVFGVLPNGVEGAYAEQLVIAARLCAFKPERWTHVEAAAAALAGLTALVALDTLALLEGETIFIQGGSGGVGGMAVWMARRRGAHVITTARGVNHEYVKSLGADRAVDYTQEDPAKVVSGCDAALDTVGGGCIPACFTVLRQGGRAAFVGSGPIAPPAPRPYVGSLRPWVGRSRDLLDRVAALLADDAIGRFRIESMPLAEARVAHERSQEGHVRGKIVLVP